jgi:Tfp pilus assembly PilM family ATPase
MFTTARIGMDKKNKILIDIGSSTVKVYELLSNSPKLLVSRSIPFKDNFDPDKGISEENKKELYELISEIRNKYPKSTVKLFATALYRKLSQKAKQLFVDEFFEKTGLFFNVIDHELENFYLQVALVGKYKNSKKPILLINIGGGSTELVVMFGKEAVETKNIDIGVGTILTEFETINNNISQIDIEKVVDFIKEKLPPLQNKVDLAFYSGGELNYMQIAGYKLQKNIFFRDKDHPSFIKIKDFVKRNKEIFSKVTLDELEKLMPENPKWMHGARACSAIAQAICEKYKIKSIIPSNSNLIDGVSRQEFRYVTISGSFRKHLNYILKIKDILAKKGVEVLSPRFTDPKNPGEEFVIFSGEENLTPLQLERYHLDSISKSDALIVCDPEGYVGASALIEIGYAHSLGKRIIFTEKPEEFMLNTLPSEIGF